MATSAQYAIKENHTRGLSGLLFYFILWIRMEESEFRYQLCYIKNGNDTGSQFSAAVRSQGKNAFGPHRVMLGTSCRPDMC